jgi:hypothetical protein
MATGCGLEVSGKPIEVTFIDAPRSHRGKLHSGGAAGFEIHGASFVRERRIVLDRSIRASDELDRILIHELFHFAWVRLGNPRRSVYERILLRERELRTRGELGWSAESRKLALRPDAAQQRTRRWREYACESFCDTAAWLLGNVNSHSEFTLSLRARERRRRWFEQHNLLHRISV